jgi:hypothetical protein
MTPTSQLLAAIRRNGVATRPAELLAAIRRDVGDRPTFCLPPTRVAAVVGGLGWLGASATIESLVKSGDIVVVARNPRGNLVYRLSVGDPVPLPPGAKIPIERFVGRGMTSRHDKAECVLAFLRSRHRAGEPFSLTQNEGKVLLRTSCRTISDAVMDLIANGVLMVVEPMKTNGGARPGGKRGAIYALTGRDLPARIVVSRRTSLAPRVDISMVFAKPDSGAGLIFTDSER